MMDMPNNYGDCSAQHAKHFHMLQKWWTIMMATCPQFLTKIQLLFLLSMIMEDIFNDTFKFSEHYWNW